MKTKPAALDNLACGAGNVACGAKNQAGGADNWICGAGDLGEKCLGVMIYLGVDVWGSTFCWGEGTLGLQMCGQ